MPLKIENQNCIFCGGLELATTEDHVPAKCLFFRKMWPVGYSFPACESCNRATRIDEAVVAAIFRMTMKEHSEEETAEFEKYLAGVINNAPGVLHSMMMTTREKRSELRRMNVKLYPGLTYSELPMVKLSGSVLRSVDRFMFKLGCALHYLHLARPLPPEGMVGADFRTNLANYMSPLTNEVLEIVPDVALVERSNQPLQDQFSYRYRYDTKTGLGIFICMFHLTNIVTLITAEKPQDLKRYEAKNRSFFRVSGYLSKD